MGLGLTYLNQKEFQLYSIEPVHFCLKGWWVVFYNIIVLEWLGNNGSKMWEWQEFPPLPLLIPININCHL